MSMLTHRILTAAAAAGAALAVVAAMVSPAMASSSYTWGYGYTRTRVSQVLMQEKLPDAQLLTSGPFIAPSPNPEDESQSTPIVVGDTLYAFAFSDAEHGTLYTARLHRSYGGPGPLHAIVQLTASTEEAYDSPGDPSVSPDGKWLAFAAGYHLYWWRIGDWGETYERSLQKRNNDTPTFVGSAPLFVPDNSPGSGGWDVCSGTSNGRFVCYAVAGINSIIWTLAYTTSDGAGITSSAILAPVGPGGAEWVCFGVAAPYPAARIVCLNPHGPGKRVIGRGVILAPVDSALAYAGGDIWATDQDGGVYAFNAATGQLAAENVSPALTGGGMSISPPAVDLASGQVFTVGDGYSRICDLRAANLALYECWGGPELHQLVGDFTAPTAVPVTYQGMACDDVWSAANGGYLGAAIFCPGKAPSVGTYFTSLPDFRTGHNFSAVVAGVGPRQRDVVLWSDTAVSAWRGFDGPPQADFVQTPPSSTGGGIEVWVLSTPMTVWAEANPATAPAATGLVPTGGECIMALTRFGEFAYLSANTSLQPSIPTQTGTGVITSTSGEGAGTGPLFSSHLPGCPPAAHGTYYADMVAEYGAGPLSSYYPEGAGDPPADWSPGEYQLWWASGVEVPAAQGAFPFTVAGMYLAGGGEFAPTGTLQATAAIILLCPTGDFVGQNTGACHPPQHCVVGGSCEWGHCPSGTQPDGALSTCCPPSEGPGPNDQGCESEQLIQQQQSTCPPNYVWNMNGPNPKCVGAVLVGPTTY
jgi:hypothetical protein